MAEPWVIATTDLRKTYGAVEALSALNLRVPRGSIFGLLGRNGAGKTTAMKILLGMVRPTGGEARVFDLAANDPGASVEIRRRTGFVSEDKDLYESMSVDTIIRFTAAVYPRWRGDLEQRYRRQFELPPARRVVTLSRGTRTKLALLLALCRGADLLILDEPTSGLDPAITEEVLQALVAHVAREQMTVLFSSHQLADVDQIADHVAIVARGRTVVSGGLDDLRERFRRIQIVFDSDAPAVMFHAPGVERVERRGRVVTVLSSAGADAVVNEARAFSPVSIEAAPVTLKEIFLEAANAQD